MTKLYDGLISDLFQNNFKYNPELIAMSYAIQQEKQRIMDNAAKTRLMSVIDELDEDILDLLAVEFRFPYYRQDLTLDQKRDIIRNAMRWWRYAGTTGAMDELITVLFGEGFTEEWFDFYESEGPVYPGEFDLIITAELQDPMEFVPALNRMIWRIKNTRSHLRSVKFLRKALTTISPAAAITQYADIFIGLDFAGAHTVDQTEHLATLPDLYSEVTIRNSIEASGSAYTGPVSATLPDAAPHVTIGNMVSRSAEASASPANFGTFLRSAMHNTVRKFAAYYQDTAPEDCAPGDLWYNTSTASTVRRSIEVGDSLTGVALLFDTSVDVQDAPYLHTAIITSTGGELYSYYRRYLISQAKINTGTYTAVMLKNASGWLRGSLDWSTRTPPRDLGTVTAIDADNPFYDCITAVFPAKYSPETWFRFDGTEWIPVED